MKRLIVFLMLLVCADKTLAQSGAKTFDGLNAKKLAVFNGAGDTTFFIITSPNILTISDLSKLIIQGRLAVDSGIGVNFSNPTYGLDIRKEQYGVRVGPLTEASYSTIILSNAAGGRQIGFTYVGEGAPAVHGIQPGESGIVSNDDVMKIAVGPTGTVIAVKETSVAVSIPIDLANGKRVRIGGQNMTLQHLGNVVITSPVNGQVLTYLNGNFVNANSAGGGGSSDSVAHIYVDTTDKSEEGQTIMIYDRVLNRFVFQPAVAINVPPGYFAQGDGDSLVGKNLRMENSQTLLLTGDDNSPIGFSLLEPASLARAKFELLSGELSLGDNYAGDITLTQLKGPQRSQSVTVPSPVVNELVDIIRLGGVPIVIDSLAFKVKGTTPSVTPEVRFATDGSAAGTSVKTFSAVTSQAGVTIIPTQGVDNTVITSGNWIWLKIGAVSGTVTSFHVTIYFHIHKAS